MSKKTKVAISILLIVGVITCISLVGNNSSCDKIEETDVVVKSEIEDKNDEKSNLENQKKEEEKAAEDAAKAAEEARLEQERLAEEKRLEEERLAKEAEIAEAARIEAERVEAERLEAERVAEEQRQQEISESNNFYVTDGIADHDSSTGYDSPYSDPNEPFITEEYGYVTDGNNYIHKNSDCKFIRGQATSQVPVSSSGKGSCNCWYY